jgi:putative transferase (TIGR04331 family)
MGIAKYNQSEDHQKLISDNFTSWGWHEKKCSKIIPMPALQLTRPNPVLSLSGDVLVIAASYPRYFYCQYSIPIAGQYIEYLKGIENFVKSISKEQNVFIRITDDIFGWEVADRFKAVGLEGNIENTEMTLFQRLASCKICVCTYNATVFLETLATNFPTIIFFDPKYFEIRQEAQIWVDKLREVGILYNSPDEAAEALSKIEKNIKCWWEGAQLQKVRIEFCTHYALRSENWMDVWSKYLQTIKFRL